MSYISHQFWWSPYLQDTFLIECTLQQAYSSLDSPAGSATYQLSFPMVFLGLSSVIYAMAT